MNLTRDCENDYRVDGTNFVIKKGQRVIIPAFSIHNDPDIFPNPAVYDPNRFTPEEQAKRSPYAYMAFGHGPRNCIGLRFGIMQAKIGLAMLLNNFKFEPCSRSVFSDARKNFFDLDLRIFVCCFCRTVSPIEFAESLFILTPKDGVYLKVTRI